MRRFNIVSASRHRVLVRSQWLLTGSIMACTPNRECENCAPLRRDSCRLAFMAVRITVENDRLIAENAKLMRTLEWMESLQRDGQPQVLCMTVDSDQLSEGLGGAPADDEGYHSATPTLPMPGVAEHASQPTRVPPDMDTDVEEIVFEADGLERQRLQRLHEAGYDDAGHSDQESEDTARQAREVRADDAEEREGRRFDYLEYRSRSRSRSRRLSRRSRQGGDSIERPITWSLPHRSHERFVQNRQAQVQNRRMHDMLVADFANELANGSEGLSRGPP